MPVTNHCGTTEAHEVDSTDTKGNPTKALLKLALFSTGLFAFFRYAADTNESRIGGDVITAIFVLVCVIVWFRCNRLTRKGWRLMSVRRKGYELPHNGGVKLDYDFDNINRYDHHANPSGLYANRDND